MLCEVCKDGLEAIWDASRTERVCRKAELNGAGVMDAERAEDVVFGHHKSYDSFLRSREGCAVCILLDDFAPRGGDAPRMTRFGYFTLFSVSKVGNLPPGVTIYGEGASRKTFLVPEHRFNLDDFNCNPGKSTQDPETWALIESWLEECRHTHETCGKERSTYVPTRLIELTSKPTEKQFRVIEGSQAPPGLRYATLSHCWGTSPWDPDLILTSRNLPSLTTPQPVSILPKTFRDALSVVERLSLRHLWIDRFCVLQDSTADWRRESSAMQRVYSASYLNISALGARDDAGGLFFPRNPAIFTPTPLHLSLSGPGEQHHKSTFYHAAETTWALKSFGDAELPWRAWIIQERLLAPWVLHFGRGQVYWECREANRCERHARSGRWTKTETRLGTAAAGELRRAFKSLINSWAPIPSPDPVAQLFKEWYSVLGLYTQCGLTKEGDKLVALGGVAKFVKDRLGELRCREDGYLAGMWRRELPGELLWGVAGPARRPRGYRAPSWSWASVEGGIRMTDNVYMNGVSGAGLILLSEVVDVRVDCCTSDETGEVEGGMMVLKGPLLAMSHPESSGGLDHEKRIRKIRKLSLPGTGQVLVDMKENGVVEGRHLGERRGSWFDVTFDVEAEMCDLAFCVPIATVTRRTLFGLALRLVEGGRYARIGLVDLCFPTEEQARGVLGQVSVRETEIV